MASSQPPIDKVILRPERTSSSSAQTIKSQANQSTAGSTNRSNIRRKPSPYVRQHDLVTRLKATLQAQKKSVTKDDDVTRDGVNGSNPSSRKRPFPFPNEVQSNACNPSLNENPSASLETGQVWEELSSFLPLLTFGEESDELLSNLLRWVGDQNHECKTINELFSSWAIFLEKMLRNRHDLNGSDSERPLSKRRKNSTKREFHSEDRNPNHSSIDSTRNLPWSVILRLIIRMTRFVAKQVSNVVLVDSDNNTCGANDCTEDEAGCSENEDTTVHPLFQSLDLVLADLQIMMRMRRSSEVPNVFVQDRMLTDWRVHPKYNNGRFVWGPSRHAFVRNAEAISVLLELKHTKVDVIEWKEKINSIVEILDACCVRRIPVAVEPCADTLLSDNLKSLSAEVVDEKMKSTSSLSNIARRHLLRLEQIQEQEIKLLRKQHAKPLEATINQNQCSPNTVRSISVQHTSANNAAGVMTSQEDEVDELEDAYRAALAFMEKNDSRGSSRKAIESRFDFLVKLLERYKDNDSGENNDNFNVHGAEAYLENLLCSLVNPSDPEVWIRFMNESHGKESAADLRRGRSMLVSFLVAIRSPGWKNALQRLCPSPLPSYLGFLSDREMQSPFSAKPKEEGKTFRSSMLLPIESACSSTLPPRISELGLSLCIGDFLQKGAENEELHFHASKNNFGVSLFRNFGPFQQINSSNCDDLLQSISTPLPDVRELTQDLFDLTLRLAASEDGNDKNNSNSPSLAAHTATESLKTLFQVLSDYSEWLTPNAIVSRYRFVLIQVIDSFKCIDFDKNSLLVSGLGIDVDDEGSWTKRAESLIETATSASVRGRILLYATQFMSMLATNQLRAAQSPGKTSSSRFVNNSHFYSCLQFRQISRFWNHVDKATKHSYSSNCLSRVFDNSFCSIILLSLSHRFSMIVANSSMATLHKSRHTMQNKSSKSILSLLTILCSVFNVFAEDDLINDCWHLGWAVMLLSLSANHFVFGVDFITNDEYPLEYFIDKSVLSNLASNLRKLYLSVWRKEPQPCRGKANILKSITQNDFIFYESNKVNHRGSKNTFILLPAFDTLVSSLVIFASRDSKNSSSWCQYASNILLRKYETAVFLNNNDHSVCESCLYANAEFTFVSLWIRHLVANMQKIILNHFVNFDGGKKIDKSTFDESTDQMLNRLMTPLLRTLHANILQQSNSALPYEERNCSECGNSKEKGFISYIFVSLFREESEKFLNKPTPTKTRNWGVYKKCIEKLLLSTPACAIFTFPRTEGLSQHSADALECVWDQYGQCNLSNATFIMIAAALHVNGSVPHISSSHAALTNRDASSAKLKQYYDAFSYRAKECIRKSVDFFKRQGDAEASLSDYNKTNSDFQVMVCSVRRGLSSLRAVVGLCWWEEIISHLNSESGDRICSTSSIMIENRKMRDIEKACSALEQDLSAISN